MIPNFYRGYHIYKEVAYKDLKIKFQPYKELLL